MGWYQVVKTIHGRRYLYWQRTQRIGGKVKTFNRYICPADSPRAVFAHAINKPATISPREKWRDDKVYAYVKSWGEYEYTSEQDAAIYARNLEYGEGGSWHPVQLHSKFWRAHRCADCDTAREYGAHRCAKHYDEKEDNARAIRETGTGISPTCYMCGKLVPSLNAAQLCNSCAE